jgi:hypothetical protein
VEQVGEEQQSIARYQEEKDGLLQKRQEQEKETEGRRKHMMFRTQTDLGGCSAFNLAYWSQKL